MMSSSRRFSSALRLLVALVMSVASLQAKADTADLKRQIGQLADEVKANAPGSNASDANLQVALDYLRQAASLLRAQTGPNTDPSTESGQIQTLARLGQLAAETNGYLKEAQTILDLNLADQPGAQSKDIMSAILNSGEPDDATRAALVDAQATIDAWGSDMSGIGYTLCLKSNTPSNCARDGSLGYGLCTMKNPTYNCSTTGSLGYGVCTLKNPTYNCSTTGNLGYAVCSLHNPTYNCSTSANLVYGLCTIHNPTQNCHQSASLGYALCVKNNPTYNCSTTGSLGYGVCTRKNPTYNCATDMSIATATCSATNPTYNCSSSGTIGYAICTAHNPTYNCRTDASLTYGVCTITNPTYNCVN